MGKINLSLCFLACVLLVSVESTRNDLAFARSVLIERNPVVEVNEDIISGRKLRGYKSKSGAVSEEELIHEEDMDLTVSQYIKLYSPDNGRNKRQAGNTDWAEPWTNGVVPYALNGNDFDDDSQADLQTAMKTIEKWSCVRFRQRTADDKNSVLFQNGDRGTCSSSVGMTNRGEQQINLSKPGCRLIGTYMHEMLHALGFVHEHQLPTRTGFLNLYMVNSKAEKQHNFKPYVESAMVNYRQEYDLGSIMHYSAKSFNMNGRKTMSTKQDWQDEYVGIKHYRELSYGDVKSLNMFYKCAAGCSDGVRSQCEAAGGFLLSDCSCLKSKAFNDVTCVDTKSAKYCNAQLLNGECFMESRQKGLECPRTCGYCGVFRTGEPARVEDKQCDDYYFDQSKCADLKDQGYCEEKTSGNEKNYHKWMGTFCAKTCGVCTDSTPRFCPNFLLLEYMCFHYPTDYCTETSSRWHKKMLTSCRTKCGLCNSRKEGACDNVRPDAECNSRADAGECDENAIEMYQHCPKTCDRCGFNTGPCENFHSDEQDCLEMASINHCLTGGNTNFMQKRCAKSCNTCIRATVPCEDIDDARRCEFFARVGHCTYAPRETFMKRRCAKSCKFC